MLFLKIIQVLYLCNTQVYFQIELTLYLFSSPLLLNEIPTLVSLSWLYWLSHLDCFIWYTFIFSIFYHKLIYSNLFIFIFKTWLWSLTRYYSYIFLIFKIGLLFILKVYFFFQLVSYIMVFLSFFFLFSLFFWFSIQILTL